MDHASSGKIRKLEKKSGLEYDDVQVLFIPFLLFENGGEVGAGLVVVKSKLYPAFLLEWEALLCGGRLTLAPLSSSTSIMSSVSWASDGFCVDEDGSGQTGGDQNQDYDLY